MKKLIIDLNSIVTASLLVGKDADAFKEDGETINTWEYGFNNFLNTYRKTMEDLGLVPMHTIGVFDAPKSRERRQRILSQYKAHRKPRPKAYYTEFNTLMTSVKQFIRHLGGTIVSAAKFEADDVIASIAPRLDCVIWSKDKDLLSIGMPMYMDGQLYVEDHCDDRFLGLPRQFVRLYRTLVGDSGDFGPGTAAQGFGEKKFMDLWAIFGDEGLQELGSMIENKKLDELSESIAELPSLQKIIDGKSMVYKTWKLAGWLPIKDHKLNWLPGFVHGADCASFDEDFLEYYQNETLVTAENFDVLLLLIKSQVFESDYVTLDIETDVPEESVEWLADIKANISRPPVTIDVLMSYLVGLSITVGDNMQHTYYFDVAHLPGEGFKGSVDTYELRDLICSINKPIIVYNAGGFELPVLFNEWDEWVPDVHCCMIAQSYVDENSFSGLKGATNRYFHYKQQSYQDVTQGRGMAEITAEEVLSYGCDDTIMTAGLFNFYEMVMDVEGTFETYVEVEQYPMYMVAHAFVNGITCDLERLQELHDEDKKEYDLSYAILEEYLTSVAWPGAEFIPLDDLSTKSLKRAYKMRYGEDLKTRFRKIEKIAALMEDEQLSEIVLKQDLGELNQYVSDNFTPCIEFKPNSWVQKADLMYRCMQLPIRYRNELTDPQKKIGVTEGTPGTDEDCVKWAMKDATPEQQKVLTALLRCINYRTRNGLYYSPYPYLVHWNDKNLHPNLKQSSTTSRRFAPAGPNVNQIPKRSEEGRKIRQCVVPHHEDAVIVSPDETGQELRLGAWVSQDANFLACYIGENLKDLHSVTAFEISKKQEQEFKTYEEFAQILKDKTHPLYAEAKEYRGVKAKPTNFLSQYVSLGGGSWTLGKKLQIEEDTAKAFLEAKSAAFPGVDEWKAAYSLQVRRQGYAETLLGARKHVAGLFARGSADHILRSSLNFKIQSSAAEQTKLILAAIWAAGIMDRYDVRFYMPVHDEVCFSVAKKDLTAFAMELKPIMTQPYADMEVPIESSFSVGYNFGQMDEIEWEATEEWLANN